MKALKIAEIPAILILGVGIALDQDASHDVDKGVTKTGHVMKDTGKRVVHSTKSGVKDAVHGTKVAAKDTAKGVKKASKKTGKEIQDAASK
jgi:hypothetical protein